MMLPVMSARVMRPAPWSCPLLRSPIIQHCEDLKTERGGDMHEGARRCAGDARHSASSEDVRWPRDLVLAQLTGARLPTCPHLDSQPVAMVDYARRHGLPVTCEATPHHSRSPTKDQAPTTADYKMKPPLVGPDRAALVRAIAAGAVTAIATGHAPHPGSKKCRIRRCPVDHLAQQRSVWRSTGWFIRAGSAGSLVNCSRSSGRAPTERCFETDDANGSARIPAFFRCPDAARGRWRWRLPRRRQCLH